MRNGIIPAATILALVALAVLLLSALPSADRQFDSSPIGSRGLEYWLNANGVEVKRSSAHIAANPADLSIRVLPLRAASLQPSSDKYFAEWVLEEKVLEMPTLIVLPKWRDELIAKGIAAANMLLDIDQAHAFLGQIYLDEAALVRQGPHFEQAQLLAGGSDAAKASLYRAQLFDRNKLPELCIEMAGMAAGVLLMQCDVGATVYVLSDPDLINNHGLSVAENAAFALAMIKTLRGADDTRPVYLDTHNVAPSPKDTETKGEGRRYTRSASDLKRFFDYPLSIIWAAALLVTAIAFWRGARRFGPPQREQSATENVSRTAAIEAMMRLLRLSGNDGRMVAQFVHDLLADKAAKIFGSRDAANIERLFIWLGRRNAGNAARLRAVSRLLVEQGPTMRHTELHRNLNLFNELLGSTDLGPG